MKPYIALCGNVHELDLGGFRSPEACKKYPGSGWAPFLVRYAAAAGVEVLSGSEALARVARRELHASDVAVIQEEENSAGIALTAHGADPALLLCMESPLFTPHFYDRIEKWKARFRRQLLFSGGTDHLFFPSFDEETLKQPEPWGARRPLVTVFSNKHYSGLPAEWEASPSFLHARSNQLHDTRYRALEHFLPRGMMLYGKGWGLPNREIPMGDKTDWIRGFKFALCFENTALLGYVTEKVIDCLVAGVIPVYLGAPNVGDFVFSSAIIRLGRAKQVGMDALEQRLIDFPTPVALNALRSGQRFLRAPEGRRYSYQGFARNVLEMLGEG